jgi:large subunit ribosomal protein L18
VSLCTYYNNIIVLRGTSKFFASPGLRLGYAITGNKDLKKEIGYGGNKEAAAKVGKAIAEKATEKGIKEVCFDRGGYLFHGRVKELADAAREAGLDF